MSAFIDERRADFGVEPICRVLGVSASAYYHRKSGQRSPRVVEDERLLPAIRLVAAENYDAYGYRRTWKALRRQGELGPRCQVQRLMRGAGIQGAKRRGRPWRATIAGADARRRPDLLERDFTADRPNQRWVADFTYVRCWEGLAFFAFVLDVHSRFLVGWQFAGHMRDTLVIDAVEMAVGQRHPDPVSISCITPTGGRNTAVRTSLTRCWRTRFSRRSDRPAIVSIVMIFGAIVLV